MDIITYVVVENDKIFDVTTKIIELPEENVADYDVVRAKIVYGDVEMVAKIPVLVSVTGMIYAEKAFIDKILGILDEFYTLRKRYINESVENRQYFKS